MVQQIDMHMGKHHDMNMNMNMNNSSKHRGNTKGKLWSPKIPAETYTIINVPYGTWKIHMHIYQKKKRENKDNNNK